MKLFNKVLGIAAVVSLVIGLAVPVTVDAATTPSLGIAGTFGILSSTYTNTAGGTTINGDLGYTTGPAVSPTVSGLTHVANITYNQASIAQGLALSALASQPCTWTSPAGAIDLSTSGPSGGTYTPGVYCTTAAASIGSGGITLNGSGTYIFRINGALTTVANSTVTLAGGASACDVFWTPTGATTLGANSTFAGIDIDNSGITVGSTVAWSGMALASGGTVSTTSDTITACAAAAIPPAPGVPQFGTINVVKTVVNDNGGTRIVADFPLFVNGTQVTSGVTNTYPAPATVYTVTETGDSSYTRTFSGDCDMNGQVNLVPGDNKFCIITNNDAVVPGLPNTGIVPPLIDVVKVPSPLALPNGPGPVTYTYTLRNIGTVPVTNVTMVGDTCVPITLISGDTNNNAVLDVFEAWIHTCTTNLTQTHTNTVVATGWANGISAVDAASATVVVGAGVVPPLIHVTKVPSPLALFASGGMVTYTETVTNPGTVPLSNVSVVDDKCGPVNFVSGDNNGNSLLDNNETWNYTCTTNLTQTTTNTATASGDANGMTARDFAVATVVVFAPAFPNTGFFQSTPWNIAVLAGSLMLVLILLAAVLRKQTI